MVIRPADPGRDFVAIAALHSAYNPDFRHEPLTAQRLQENERLPGRTRRQFVALADDGALLGSAQALHGPWLPAGTFDLTVLVDAARRGRGVGSALYQAARDWAAQLGATRVETEVVDNDPAALAFATHRGFTVGYHRFKSVLALADFDPAPFTGVLARISATGVHIERYADRPDDRRRLYELHCRGELDEPSSTGCTPYDEYSRATFDRPDVVVFLAVTAAGDWVGLAQLECGPDRAHHELSCVDREWRGRGIAQTLKFRAVSYAGERGLTQLTTTNDSRNSPMLAINQKFGYRPELGVYQLFGNL